MNPVLQIVLGSVLFSGALVTAATTDTLIAGPLSLEQYVVLVKEHHPRAHMAASLVEAARARAKMARAPMLPSLAGRGQASFGPQPGAPGSIDSRRSYFAGVEGSQEIFDFGQSFADFQAARLRSLAVESQQRDAISSLEVLAHETYYGYLLAETTLSVAQGLVVQAEVNLEQARILVETGRLAPYYSIDAEAELAQARLGLVQAQNGSRLARLELEVLSGVTLPESLRMSDSLAALPDFIALEQASTTALKQAHLLRAGENLEKAGEQAAKAAARARLPNLHGTAAYGYVDADGSGDWEEGWSAGLVVSVPILAGGALSAARSLARAESRVASQELALRKLELELQVRGNHIALQEALESVEAAQALVRQSEAAYQLALERYRLGAAASLELTDAEQRLAGARLELARAHYKGHSAHARLLATMGVLGKKEQL